MSDNAKPTQKTFECCFCNTLGYSSFCMECSVKIANDHVSILKFIIGMYPDAEPLQAYKQKTNNIKTENKTENKTITNQQKTNNVEMENKTNTNQQKSNIIVEHHKKTDAEKKREWRAKKKEELGEEEFKKQATIEKRIQRTGTAEQKRVMTPEEREINKQLSHKKYQEKQKAKKEQQ